MSVASFYDFTPPVNQLFAALEHQPFLAHHTWPQFDYHTTPYQEASFVNIEARIISPAANVISCDEGSQDYLRLMRIENLHNPGENIQLAFFSSRKSDLNLLEHGYIITARNAKFLRHIRFGWQAQITGDNLEWTVQKPQCPIMATPLRYTPRFPTFRPRVPI
ncbi:hypothetical protein EMPS_08781 [Entomortierella parvispora]|uniref:Uncharacterized protein n=1 Tax=Entomortierella parvispora TaxID=205924 RepID=A0A9P3HGY5_9FUNG|nr:hypothetical protein EMPS_08781 [Entomortierella parvispora]